MQPLASRVTYRPTSDYEDEITPSAWDRLVRAGSLEISGDASHPSTRASTRASTAQNTNTKSATTNTTFGHGLSHPRIGCASAGTCACARVSAVAGAGEGASTTRVGGSGSEAVTSDSASEDSSEDASEGASEGTSACCYCCNYCCHYHYSYATTPTGPCPQPLGLQRFRTGNPVPPLV